MQTLFTNETGGGFIKKFYKISDSISSRLIVSVLICVFLTGMLTNAFAGKRYSVANGNWSSTSTWSLTSGGSPGASVPTNGDTVYIEKGKQITVDVPAICDTMVLINDASGISKLRVDNVALTINGGLFLDASIASGNNDVLSLNGAATVIVNGSVTVYADTRNGTIEVADNSVLTINGNVYLTDISGKKAELKGKNNGIININGDVIFSATAKDKAKIKLQSNSVLNITGNFDRTASGNYGDLDCSTSSTVNYCGTSPQILSNKVYNLGTKTKKWKYGNITINNLAGVTLDTNIIEFNNSYKVRGDLRIQTGILYSGGFSIELTNTHEFEITNGTYYTTTQDATGGMLETTSNASYNFGPNSLVEFAALGAQNVPELSNNKAYGNVIISGTGTKILVDNIDIDGNLTINSSLDADVAQDYYINLAGNWTNNGTFTARNGNVTFNGTTAQSIDGAVTTFYDFTINKASDDLTLNVNTNVDHMLSLTSGDVILGTNTLTLGVSSLIGGSPGSGSYVQADGSGLLRRNMNTAATLYEYPIGDNNEYSNFNITLNSATFGGGDYIEMRVQDIKHFAIDTPNFISRFWVMNSANFSAINYDVEFYYLDADINGTEANYIASRWDGIFWAEYDAVFAVANQLTSSTNITVIPSTHIFSAGSTSALPIQLTRFDARLLEFDKVELSWITAAEINNSFFTVERSDNGEDFYEIATVMGAGNSAFTNDYSFLDQKEVFATTYYRLKQTDFNGHFEYFEVISINKKIQKPDIIVYPNPSNGRDIILKFTQPVAENVLVVLYNSLGEIIYSSIINDPQDGVNIAQDIYETLTPGIYMIVGSSHEELFRQRLIIQ